MKTNSPQAPDPYYILRGHKAHINSIVFDKQNSNILYSGSGDGELKLWNIEEKKCLSTLAPHVEGGVLSLQSTLGGHLISQGRDGTIKIWSTTDGSTLTNIFKLETYSMSLGKCYSLLSSLPSTDSGSTNLLSISSEESKIDIWDLNNKSIITKLKPTNNQFSDKLGLPMNMKLISSGSNDSIRLCAGYESGEMLMWDLRNDSVPLVSSKLHSEPILSFDLSKDGIRGISGSGDSNIIEFNINYETRKFDVTKTHKLNNPGISEIKIRNDEKIYATSGWDKRIRIFNFKKQTPLAILKYHSESVYSIDFSGDNILASASKDSRIALWDIYRTKQ
ncbi:hypothetical protein DICPUDRAFT_148995 [Dictyostelium purpureum]|uniref:Uncharacterized protein n=1 Tax=Dictyostelium purpureum TaxID=5786 RepID=F0ZCJ3_DICPU|nr:uncharacterized protein DICPUDRAFT_148995 [Dictyostelium purpureum]EGC38380.1 hypothetical protein DICPUDRAFT_148995 [Dictyostelium purpureum]|eukprot:XP_003285137.1 hypothetical protein DICPUDRAFT_148995 [Dictyostelium purpureum]